jgi:ribosomal protein S11
MSQNNVFCHFKDLIKKKSLFVMSAGKCNVKISKKNLRFNNKFIFKKFIKKIKPFIKKKTFFLKILAPIKIRKKLLKSLKGFLKQRSVIIKVKAHKCFNGCRPKKAKRKKQKKWVVYK